MSGTGVEKGDNKNNDTSGNTGRSDVVERENVVVYDYFGYKGKYSGSCYVVIPEGADGGSGEVEGAEGSADSVSDSGRLFIPDGEGTMEYFDHPDVVRYCGKWKNGEWHGVGTSEMRNGDKYNGEHRCTVSRKASTGRSRNTPPNVNQQQLIKPQRHGFGTYTWKDERKYSGNFECDLRHGQGRHTWADGTAYEGNFVKGVPSGYGTYTSPKESYIGEWKDGEYHGYGVQKIYVTQRRLKFDGDEVDGKNAEGRTYRGNFEKGKRQGYGVEMNPDGSIIHDGEWEQDQQILSAEKFKKRFSNSFNSIRSDSDDLIVVENELVTDASGIQGIYRGILHAKTRLPHGNGTLVVEPDDEQQRQQLLREKQRIDPAATSTCQNSIKYYEGFYEQGHQHGRGRLCWTNGDTYEGDFVYGKRSGYGTYRWNTIYKYQSYYKGEFYNDLRHGKGTLVLYNQKTKSTYEGSFFEGRRSGYGKLYEGSSSFEGQWKHGVYNGHGMLINKDGTKYRGNFENGKPHGLGKKFDSHGIMMYEGQWCHGLTIQEFEILSQQDQQRLIQKPAPSTGKGQGTGKQSNASMQHEKEDDEPCETVVDQYINDAKGNDGQYTGIVLASSKKPHGVGRMLYSSGHLIYEGFWNYGIKHGHGRCIFLTKGDFHEGEYCENLRNGPGTYQWQDGRTYVGNYKNDLRHGKGVITYPNGDKYDGMFYNGERSGFGRFEFSKHRFNGNENASGYYEGQFKKGKYHGLGKLQMNDTLYEGVFKDGLFLKKSNQDSTSIPNQSKGRIQQEELGNQTKPNIRGARAQNIGNRNQATDDDLQDDYDGLLGRYSSRESARRQRDRSERGSRAGANSNDLLGPYSYRDFEHKETDFHYDVDDEPMGRGSDDINKNIDNLLMGPARIRQQQRQRMQQAYSANSKNDTSSPNKNANDNLLGPPANGSDNLLGPPPKGNDNLLGPPAKGNDNLLGQPAGDSDNLLGPPARGNDNLLGPPAKNNDSLLGPPASSNDNLLGSPVKRDVQRKEGEVKGRASDDSEDEDEDSLSASIERDVNYSWA